MSEYDNRRELLDALAAHGLKKQDVFLSQFINTPRDLHITDKNLNASELLKLTYVRLLEDIFAKISIELETLK